MHPCRVGAADVAAIDFGAMNPVAQAGSRLLWCGTARPLLRGGGAELLAVPA
jgi:hypothetical protein